MRRRKRNNYLGKITQSRETLATVMVLLMFILPACTADGVKRGIYEGLYQQQCMDSIKLADCNPEHLTYDQYELERREAQMNNRLTNASVK